MPALASEYALNTGQRGPLEVWTHFGQAGAPGEGAFVQIWLVASQNDKTVLRCSFETHGCMWSMACASVVAQLARGRSLEKARLIEAHDIDLVLGGIPEGKGGYAEMAVCALRRALGEEE